MFLGHMLPGQMSPWQLASVKDGPRNLILKFGQNQVSNSWYGQMSPDKCQPDSWHLLKMVPGTYLKSLVKVRYITAEIFLIWTNVVRTNVAWTNVTLTPKICSFGPRNLPLKFGQNGVSNSWDMMLWRWRWRFDCDYIANSAQLDWDLAELGKKESC